MAVLVGAAPRDDVEASDLGELGPHFVGHPVREVGVGGIAQVLEGKYGEHLRRGGPARAWRATVWVSRQTKTTAAPRIAASAAARRETDAPARRGLARSRGPVFATSDLANRHTESKRSPGSIASARCSACVHGLGNLGPDGAHARRRLRKRVAMIAAAVGPVKGGAPASIS